MKSARKRSNGMTLIEMVAALSVLMIMTLIMAQVFFQAARASAKGKGLGEIYQVGRALQRLVAKDLSGATPDFFAGAENGSRVYRVVGLPPGPYHTTLTSTPPPLPYPAPHMRRMLMGGSDYLAFTSSNAGGASKAVSKVFYCLRESGELVREAYTDTKFDLMDYLTGAYIDNRDLDNPADLNDYEEHRVVAENIQRVKFSYLDRNQGPICENAPAYAEGVWLDRWDWNDKPYLPTAVKVELQLVDHLWKLKDEDQLGAHQFDFLNLTDDLRAPEMFDPDDGDSLRFIVHLPLGMKSQGG